jgi:transcriptional regulator with XRE-family HTH domain
MDPQDAFVTRLRRYRERSQISLDEIATMTRVKRELLEAFERNDLSEWPRGLYARAWVRAYASVVGLDPSDTVDEFCRLFPHGDRRLGGTMQEIATIVAHASEYRDVMSWSGAATGRSRRRRNRRRGTRHWHNGPKRCGLVRRPPGDPRRD